MSSWQLLNALAIVLSVSLGSDAQNPSPWHGRVLGIEDSHGPNGLIRNLTYSDFQNVPQHEILTTDSELRYLLDATSATIYVFRRRLTNEGETHRSLAIIPLNNRRATKQIEYPAVCRACAACSYCVGETQLAVSPDGRFLFTLMERLQRHRLTLQPGQFATDDDASFAEPVIVTYDSTTGRFLDGTVYWNVRSPSRYWLLGGTQPGNFEILTINPGTIHLLRFKASGPQTQNGVVLSELPAPARMPTGPIS